MTSNKICLTGFAVGDGVAEEILRFSSGKSETQRGFKDVKNLPNLYKSQKTVWMNYTILQQYVQKLIKKSIS